MRGAWLLVLVAPITGCGSEGSGAGSGTGATSSGGASTGGASVGGAGGAGAVPDSGAGSGGTGAGGSGSGGSSSGGTSSVDAGPVIPGGPCSAPIGTPASPACAQGPPVQSYCRLSNPSELIMATCKSWGLTQCEAGEACGKGWHFCTGSEYLDRGGRTEPKAAGIIYAWVAACVRDATGSKFHDGPCSVCDSDVGAPPGMIYGCSGENISPGMIDDTIGAMAETSCHRIGENIPARNGYWSINWSGHMASHTLCCID